MEITPDFHWIRSRASNIYLCRNDDGLTLVDSGMPGQMDTVLNYLSRIGRHPREIKQIIITHADIDHAGSLAAIWQKTDAVIYAGAGTADYLTTGRSPEHLPRFADWVMKHWRYRPVPAAAIETVADGDNLPILGNLKALATPGHTLDHFSFYSPDRGILLAGDALHNRRNRLQVSGDRINADKAAARASARRLLALAPAVLACGHGPPLYDHKDDVLMMLYKQLG